LIVRIVRGNVAAALVPTFHDLARRTVPEVLAGQGVVSARVARQIAADGAEEIMFVTVWRDMPALYAWLDGSDLLEVPSRTRPLESCLSGRDLQYYEVIDTDALPDDEAQSAEEAEAGGGH
jgi:heme-degrading monooxygenase HmoA